MARPMSRPDRTPVLVGLGTATRREEDWRRALEPMDLMLEAVAAAGADTGAPAALRGTQWIAVPRGRWRYANPAGEIARAIGAEDAHEVLSTVGVLQQTLIAEACARIAAGDAHTTLVAGADAGYRLLRAQIAGGKAPERVQDDAPDELLAPKEELRHPVEKRAGLVMPVGLYATLESAWRASNGWSVAGHRDRVAALWAGLAAVTEDNPHAWTRRAVPAAGIREGGPRNPMQAFPYTRFHCSTWNVDQAGALLFCSAARAAELGIPRERWVYPVASAESNHMVAVAARARLDACPGARLAGRAALDAAGWRADEVDLVDLYSCFPFAVQVYAHELGLGTDRPLTVTGGMPFAGGPYNNYVLQSTARAAELLRAGQGRTALVSCVSGIVTKQAFGLWSTEAPREGFASVDVSDATARETAVREVVDGYSGRGRVAGFTVVHGRGVAPRGLALVDTPSGARALATTEAPALVERMQQEEWVGRELTIERDEVVA
jgi:acetyl-CoA C-acetyltransferase